MEGMEYRKNYNSWTFLYKLSYDIVKFHNRVYTDLSLVDFSKKLQNHLEFLSTIQANLIRQCPNIAYSTCRTLTDFFEILKLPVNTWVSGLPKDPFFHSPLWVGENIQGVNRNFLIGRPSNLARNLASEFNLIESDGEQVRVKEVRNQLRQDGSLESQLNYVLFRKFLIENPITPSNGRDFKEIAYKIGIKQNDFYERIPSFQVFKGKFLQCSNCKWPMDLSRTYKTWECSNYWCKTKIASFKWDNDPFDLLIHEKHESPVKKDSVDYLRLKEDIWRFTTVPGLAEVELYTWLRKNWKYTTELWPDFDKYDLRINFSSSKAQKPLLVDLKCWIHPPQLEAKLLQEYQSEESCDIAEELNKVIIVVPDQQKLYIKSMRENVPFYEFMTIREFKHDLNRRKE